MKTSVTHHELDDEHIMVRTDVIYTKTEFQVIYSPLVMGNNPQPQTQNIPGETQDIPKLGNGDNEGRQITHAEGNN